MDVLSNFLRRSISFGNNILVYANGSLGTASQVLTTNGTSVYWSTSSGGGGSVNVAAQYTWTNTQTFTNVVTHSANVVLSAGITANNSGGLNTQVLMSNGSGGTFCGYAQPTGYAVRQEYTANGSQNTFTVTGGYSANNLDVYLNGVKLLNTVEVNTGLLEFVHCGVPVPFNKSGAIELIAIYSTNVTI